MATATPKVEQSQNPEQPVEQEPVKQEQQTQSVYRLGDVVTLSGRIVTMNEVSTAGGKLKATFTIENTSNENTTASSIMEWTAKNNDGEKLSQDIFDCGSSSLDGTIVAHDKLKGSICYDIIGSPPYKLYYSPDIFSSTAHVWQVD